LLLYLESLLTLPWPCLSLSYFIAFDLYFLFKDHVTCHPLQWKVSLHTLHKGDCGSMFELLLKPIDFSLYSSFFIKKQNLCLEWG
jgi:hypothetical protein